MDQPSTQPIIIWDWDDTLLCSSMLAQYGYRLSSTMDTVCPNFLQHLKSLEEAVVQVLGCSMKFGKVHIITNAETNWVQMSAKKWMPRVFPLLEHASIVSARSKYESVHPQDPMAWKLCAFSDLLNGLYTTNSTSDDWKHVISFGDSHAERQATKLVAQNMKRIRTKTVKFTERPTIEQIQGQLRMVVQCFPTLVNHSGDLDLCTTQSETDNMNQAARQAQSKATEQSSCGKEDRTVQPEAENQQSPVH